jgi:hypothetical protein
VGLKPAPAKAPDWFDFLEAANNRISNTGSEAVKLTNRGPRAHPDYLFMLCIIIKQFLRMFPCRLRIPAQHPCNFVNPL